MHSFHWTCFQYWYLSTLFIYINKLGFCLILEPSMSPYDFLCGYVATMRMMLSYFSHTMNAFYNAWAIPIDEYVCCLLKSGSTKQSICDVKIEKWEYITNVEMLTSWYPPVQRSLIENYCISLKWSTLILAIN